MGGLMKNTIGAIADVIDVVSDVVKTVWKAVGDDILGIDDEKFLGIKSNAAAKIGSVFKDVFYDHAKETVIIVAILVGGYYLYPYMELGGGLTGANSLVSYTGNVLGWTSDFAIVGIWSSAYYGISVLAGFGMSLLISGATQSYMQEQYEELQKSMEYIKYMREQLANDNYVSRIMDGSMNDWLAGGTYFNSVEAGGNLFSAIGKMDKFANIFAYAEPQTQIKDEVMARNFYYDQLTGGDMFRSVI